jgi:hypothetical protein
VATALELGGGGNTRAVGWRLGDLLRRPCVMLGVLLLPAGPGDRMLPPDPGVPL